MGLFIGRMHLIGIMMRGLALIQMHIILCHVGQIIYARYESSNDLQG